MRRRCAILPSPAAAVFRIAFASSESCVDVNFVLETVTTPAIPLRQSTIPGVTGNWQRANDFPERLKRCFRFLPDVRLEQFGDFPDVAVSTNKLKRNNSEFVTLLPLLLNRVVDLGFQEVFVLEGWGNEEYNTARILHPL